MSNKLKIKVMKSSNKLTPVQQEVMKRFENGQKLVVLETNRRSGDEMFWCKKDEKSGLWRAEEKSSISSTPQVIVG